MSFQISYPTSSYDRSKAQWNQINERHSKLTIIHKSTRTTPNSRFFIVNGGMTLAFLIIYAISC